MWIGTRHDFKPDVVHACTDPEANGHSRWGGRTTTSTAAADPEKARQERRELIRRNREMVTAQTVRR